MAICPFVGVPCSLTDSTIVPQLAGSVDGFVVVVTPGYI